MSLLPRDRYQRVVFLLFLLFFVGSCIEPPYLQFLLMQHVPTVLAALILAYLLGINISELFGFQRNHYDRIVSCGLLLAVPIQEFERRHLQLLVALSSVSFSTGSSENSPDSMASSAQREHMRVPLKSSVSTRYRRQVPSFSQSPPHSQPGSAHSQFSL